MPPLTIRAHARGGAASCPLCSETLARGGPARECPGCEVSYHVACLDELGGCGTLGCARAKRIATVPRRGATARSARETNPGLTIAFLLTGLVVLILFKAFEAEEREPPRRRARAAPTEQWRRPLRTHQVMRFVASVDFLSTIREMERQIGYTTETLREFRQATHDECLQAYEALLESSGRPPAELRAELAQELKRLVQPENYAGAEESMQEFFATLADRDPLSGRSEDPDEGGLDPSREQERELRQAAELLATGRDRTDPEVRKHVNAAAAYGRAAEEAAKRQGRSGLPASGG